MMYLKFLFNKADEVRLMLQFYRLWRSFRIKSHLTIKERVKLYELARGRSRICEIGSYIGASASAMGVAAVEAQNSRIFCVDTWNNDAMSEGHKDTYKLFCENTSHVCQCIVPVRGYSNDVVEKISEHVVELDLLFIDGDHSYEGVKSDWDAYKHLLKPGAVVVFHDCGWAPGVKRVIQEDVMPLAVGASYLPNMFWCTIEAGT